MKFTTLNFKKDEYCEEHEIFVGTHIGSFKKLYVAQEDPYLEEHLQDLKVLQKDSYITALKFSNSDKNEILIGRANNQVEVYDSESKTFKGNLKFSSSPIVGVCRYDDKIVAALGTGNVEIQQEDSNSDAEIVFNAGDNISKMRQCEMDDTLIATGGKDRQNNLKIFNLETKQKIFTSKNLPNDQLQLEVPVWDSDLLFLSSNSIATCSRYGYIRLYDIRAQRRPVKKYATEEYSFSCMIGRDNDIYVGTNKGELKAYDLRNLKNFKHTYKGFTGGISDITLDDTGKYLISANLDRYVRVHDTNSCVLLYQCYVKTKATRVLIKSIQNLNKQNEIESLKPEVEISETATIDKNTNEIDDEYEQMFKNMETITEIKEDENLVSKRKVLSSKKLKVKRRKI